MIKMFIDYIDYYWCRLSKCCCQYRTSSNAEFITINWVGTYLHVKYKSNLFMLTIKMFIDYIDYYWRKLSKCCCQYRISNNVEIITINWVGTHLYYTSCERNLTTLRLHTFS